MNTSPLSCAGNIAYRAQALTDFYDGHRSRWEELYPSERWVIERIAQENGRPGRVLDVGCAQGGLYNALRERFGQVSYLGVDIHHGLIEAAQEHHAGQPDCTFRRGDILDTTEEPDPGFDMVFSLGCADWNLRTNEIIEACWKRVAPGGHLCLTLRLHSEPSILDMESSYQVLARLADVNAPDLGEKAPYTVFNIRHALEILEALGPERVIAYGYWGEPSSSAVTPVRSVVFTALGITKARDGNPQAQAELHLPLNLFRSGAKP